MQKTSVCACLSLLMLPSLAPAQVAPGVIPGREWPSIKFTFDRNLEYAQADGRSLLLDLYIPHTGYQTPGSQPAVRLPVIVWIHGEAGQFAGRYPSPVARMVGNGYAVASIDYRSSAEATPVQQLEDCRAAIRWLRTNADKYSLDADQTGVWGIGEGGRLAALLATSAGLKEADPASRVQAAVDFSGPVDNKGLSPASFAAKDSAPVMIVHGDSDKVVPVQQSRALDAALRKAGANSTLRIVKGAGHEFKQLRQGDAAELVNNFLDQNLNGGKHQRIWLGKIDPPDDAWVDPIIDEPVGTHYVTFAAPSLGPGRMASYLIYLPPDYEKSPSKRYPVLYYLHGGAGSQRVSDIWVQKLDAAIKKGVCPPMIAVSIEGLPGGRFLDSPDGMMPIESVIIKDLIPNVDANYRTIPRRGARALEGLSMGGYGAFHFGFKFPEMFSMISGMCTGVSAPHATPRQNTPGRVETAYDLANNPFILAETNLAAIKGRFKIRSVVGTDDFTLEANKAFDARLTELGIPHEFKIVPHVSHGYKEYYEILDFSFFKTIATTM
ncbi:MAG: alpha/beta hydrolase-fold protein [Terracidiphilus sp.]